ncbi:MAG: AbrB/MazE/SpoVT family DNA-binding domain-containing protein [Candidatus Berkelbacteria bacterium]|nr:AbrB/MazE/SpoVT family DNA-binding domain-containing protein [Candidatus Berkelbacteria bacterium]
MKKFRFIKKILRLGRYSGAIVLPKMLLRALGWREKQRIEVIPDFKKGRIIIQDFKK